LHFCRWFAVSGKNMGFFISFRICLIRPELTKYFILAKKKKIKNATFHMSQHNRREIDLNLVDFGKVNLRQEYFLCDSFA
jgi:hypothetical protein